MRSLWSRTAIAPPEIENDGLYQITDQYVGAESENTMFKNDFLSLNRS